MCTCYDQLAAIDGYDPTTDLTANLANWTSVLTKLTGESALVPFSGHFTCEAKDVPAGMPFMSETVVADDKMQMRLNFSVATDLTVDTSNTVQFKAKGRDAVANCVSRDAGSDFTITSVVSGTEGSSQFGAFADRLNGKTLCEDTVSPDAAYFSTVEFTVTHTYAAEPTGDQASTVDCIMSCAVDYKASSECALEGDNNEFLRKGDALKCFGLQCIPKDSSDAEIGAADGLLLGSKVTCGWSDDAAAAVAPMSSDRRLLAGPPHGRRLLARPPHGRRLAGPPQGRRNMRKGGGGGHGHHHGHGGHGSSDSSDSDSNDGSDCHNDDWCPIDDADTTTTAPF